MVHWSVFILPFACENIDFYYWYIYYIAIAIAFENRLLLLVYLL